MLVPAQSSFGVGGRALTRENLHKLSNVSNILIPPGNVSTNPSDASNAFWYSIQGNLMKTEHPRAVLMSPPAFVPMSAILVVTGCKGVGEMLLTRSVFQWRLNPILKAPSCSQSQIFSK